MGWSSEILAVGARQRPLRLVKPLKVMTGVAGWLSILRPLCDKSGNTNLGAEARLLFAVRGWPR